jgi:hypothetical protein
MPRERTFAAKPLDLAAQKMPMEERIARRVVKMVDILQGGKLVGSTHSVWGVFSPCQAYL